MNPKEMRLVDYALAFLISNIDEDNIEDLAEEGIDEDFVLKYSRKIENLIEEHKCSL